jgi:L-2-hydroxyglutarate oxidase LhgO
VVESTDVLVIGGGIVGAATAYQLAKRGASVTLLEADQLASGATGRNLGYIWVHTRRRGPELELVMTTRNELEGLPEELGADFGLRTNGGLIYVTNEAQAAVMREFVERRTADGVPMRFLDGDEARAIAPILPDTVVAASFCPLDAQIDSRRYVRAFAAAAQRHGARVVEGATARTFEREGSRITRVQTDIGPISAGQVVLAAGAWTPYLAAQLGTMTTNQEIDALSTMGISPMEFLVLPRMLALILMMPLLTIYADLLGILGGAVVGLGMLGLGPTEYFEQTRGAVSVTDFFIGVSKSMVFGVLVALVGCLRGMQSGRSAAAVGLAATSAVVTSIVLIIVIDGIFAVVLNVLHF